VGHRPALAALLSAVVPGAGQLYAGRILRAVLVALPLIFLVAAVVITGRRGTISVLRSLVQPSVLWALIAINLAILAWRLLAVIDAWRVAGGRTARKVAIGVLVLVIVAVAIPHVVATRYGLRTIDLLTTVFAAEPADSETAAPASPPSTIIPRAPEADLVPDPAPVATDTVPSTLASPEPESNRNLIFSEGFGDPDAAGLWPEVVAAESDSPAPFLPFEERVAQERITILLAGGDSGPGRGGMRTDTIMVVTMDTVTGDAAIFGFPRNLTNTPLPSKFRDAFGELDRQLNGPPPPPEPVPDETGTTVAPPPQPAFTPCLCFPQQLNALYPYTQNWTRTFPDDVDPGMKALELTLENLMGLPIDYYVLIDMGGFVKLVDALGGVDVMVLEPIESEVSPPEEGQPWATVDVQPGMNHLSGTESLAYVRARKGSTDYVRMSRQRCLLRAVASEADPFTILTSYPAIADAVQSSTVTNIPVTFLPDMVEFAARLDFDDIATVGFNPTYYAPTWNRGPIPSADRIRWKVEKVLTEGAAQSEAGESECG
jgi:LCP family protein required for cell wall assembly